MAKSASVKPTGDHQGRSVSAMASLGLAANVAALLGVSCCVLPVLFAMLGVGGAWLGHLAIFVAYGPWLLGFGGLSLALGWVLAWRRGTSRRSVTILTGATILFVIAVLIRIYETPVNRFLLEMWRST